MAVVAPNPTWTRPDVRTGARPATPPLAKTLQRRARLRRYWPDLVVVVLSAGLAILLSLIHIHLNGLIQTATDNIASQHTQLTALEDQAREKAIHLQVPPDQVEQWALAHGMQPPTAVTPVAPDPAAVDPRADSPALNPATAPAHAGPALLNAWQGLVEGFRSLTGSGTL